MHHLDANQALHADARGREGGGDGRSAQLGWNGNSGGEGPRRSSCVLGCDPWRRGCPALASPPLRPHYSLSVPAAPPAAQSAGAGSAGWLPASLSLAQDPNRPCNRCHWILQPCACSPPRSLTSTWQLASSKASGPAGAGSRPHLQALQHEEQRVQQRQLSRRPAGLPAHDVHGGALAQRDARVHAPPLVPAGATAGGRRVVTRRCGRLGARSARGRLPSFGAPRPSGRGREGPYTRAGSWPRAPLLGGLQASSTAAAACLPLSVPLP